MHTQSFCASVLLVLLIVVIGLAVSYGWMAAAGEKPQRDTFLPIAGSLALTGILAVTAQGILT
jgi:hypothetical protein